jgi:hypothetical protein
MGGDVFVKHNLKLTLVVLLRSKARLATNKLGAELMPFVQLAWAVWRWLSLR